MREFKEFRRIKQKFLAHDKWTISILADSDFTIQMTQNKYPNVKLFLLQNLSKSIFEVKKNANFQLAFFYILK
jgi:hypothetical protein